MKKNGRGDKNALSTGRANKTKKHGCGWAAGKESKGGCFLRMGGVWCFSAPEKKIHIVTKKGKSTKTGEDGARKGGSGGAGERGGGAPRPAPPPDDETKRQKRRG